MGSIPTRLFTALVRTHHITSPKKLGRVRKAAARETISFVLVRSGGSPGIMYAESPSEASLSSWVSQVHDLRYKDFQCAQRPAPYHVNLPQGGSNASFHEIDSVEEFGEIMEQRGLRRWWEVGMGYRREDPEG